MTNGAPATANKSELTIDNPTTGETIGTLTITDEGDVVQSITASYTAQSTWGLVPAEQRGGYLHAMANALEKSIDELAELNHQETGKLLEDCRGGIQAGIGTLRQYAELGPLHRGHSLRGNALAADYTITRPRGVVAVLTPWNDPVAVAMGLIGAALVTGNTVIHKPSERNPHLGLRLGEILSSELPADVLFTVTGAGDTGRLLTSDPRVNVIAHVGSTATGQEIAEAAAHSGAHVIRENGGNDALIIDETVSPTWAASQAALGCFANAGQICTSVERVYVHRDIASDFLHALEELATAMNNSEDPAQGGSQDGPQSLVDLAHREHVNDHVQDAVSSGARLITGGTIPDGPGAHYPATVLTSCTPGMPVMREETFGPVAAVQEVDSFDEALRFADSDRYGLAATVLTHRLDRALRAVNELQVGTVKINNVFGGAPGGAAQPHKASGAGFGYGPELMDEMTTTAVVHMEFPSTDGQER